VPRGASLNLRCFGLLTTFLLAGCGEAPIAEEGQAIIGGTTDSSDPAVVALFGHRPGASSGALCTSEIIAPTVLLTAAHCVLPQTVGSGAVFSAYVGSDFNHPSAILPVKEVHADPKFSLSNLFGGHDIAVVILSAPTTIAPLPYNHSALGAGDAGQGVRLIGYGLSNGQAQTGAGTKRQTMANLNSVSATLLSIGDSQHETCEGDSGGPALFDVGGVETIVGVTSFGQLGCGGGGYDTRVDAYSAFVDGYVCASCIGATPACHAGACAACGSDSECPVAAHACLASGACGICSAGNSSACKGTTPICNTATASCVTCVSDGQCKGTTPACNTTTHTCVACTSDTQCKGTTPACNTTAHTCVACTSDTQCKGSAPACNAPTHTCVACTSDAQCHGATPACNTTTHACVACTTNAQCGGTTATCNTATHACVSCMTNAQCGGEMPACNTTTHACVSCMTNAQCGGATPACNTTTHACVACMTNAQCGGATPACNTTTHACVSCMTNAQCGGATPACNTTTHACVACTTNAQCKGTTPICSATTHSCVAH
jgi:V8-like Glu-specific endopeptidase